MKKSIFICMLLGLLCSCNLSYKNNLKQMGKAVEGHFMYNDLNNNITTTLEWVRPLSYIELTDAEKKQPEDAYLGQFYIKGKWSYMGSSLVYNMDDTIFCYFTKDLKYLRTKKDGE